MFILQEMSNYETTRSDEFCEFDGEIIQNATQSCFTKSKKIYGSKTREMFRPLETQYMSEIFFLQYLPLVNG